MLNTIKRIFRKLTPLEIAAHEMMDAELARLQAQSGQEFAAAMTAYNEARVKRLREYLKTPVPEIKL